MQEGPEREVFWLWSDDTGRKQASSCAKPQFFHLVLSLRYFRKVVLQITVVVYRKRSNRSTLGEEMRVSGGSEQNLFCSFH